MAKQKLAEWMDQWAIFDWDGPKTWDQPGADPVGDMAAAARLFKQATGRYPNSIHMSPEVRQALDQWGDIYGR